MSDNEFSVYQWFPDGSYERYKSFVGAEEAVKAAKFLTNNVASRMGITQRVIITDGGDCCVFEWTKEKGIVYPETWKTEKSDLCETHKESK